MSDLKWLMFYVLNANQHACNHLEKSVLKNVHSHDEYFPFCVRCIQFRSFKYPFKLKIKLAAGFAGIPAWDNECKVLVQSIVPCLIQTTHPVKNPNR